MDKDCEFQPVKRHLDQKMENQRANIEKILSGQRNVISARDMSESYTKIYNSILQNENNGQQFYALFESYNRQFLNTSLKMIKDQNQDILQEFIHQEEVYSCHARNLQKQFDYLDRSFVKTNQQKPSLSTCAAKQFETELVEHLQTQIQNNFLSKLHQDRVLPDPEIQLMLEKVYQVIFQLKKKCNKESSFIDNFKAAITQQSEQYYSKQYHLINSNYSIYEAIPRLCEFKDVEFQRIGRIFRIDNDFMVQLKLCFNMFVIQAFKKQISDADDEGLRGIFEQEKYNELHQLIQLINLYDQKLDGFKQKYNRIVADEIKWILQSNGANQNKKQLVYKQQIENMIAIHQKHLEILQKYGDNNYVLKECINYAVESNVRQDLNELMNALLHYFETLTTIKENEVILQIKRTVALMNCYPEKDLFLKNYKFQLGRRLLTNTKCQLEVEKVILSEMKLHCGSHYTAQLDQMVQDYELQRNHQNELNFQGILVVPLVVYSLNWPPLIPSIEVKNIPVLQQVKNAVLDRLAESDLNSKDKKFQFHDQISVVSLSFKTNRTYSVSMSTLQASILFNFQYSDAPVHKNDLLSQFEIIDCGLFDRNLQSLYQNKLVKIENDMVQFNEQFEDKRLKIELKIPFDDQSTAQKEIQDDRIQAIEACIVKLMKKNKKLVYKDLIAGVKGSLKMFDPQDAKIKECVEKLIHKDFIKRNEDNLQELIYIS